MRLQMLGFAISVFIAGIIEVQNANAQDRGHELSVTIVCVDIDSATYQEMQENLESVAQARKCQRGGLPRHELTGVFGISEIRKLVNSLVDAKKAKVCWFHEAKIRSDRGVGVPIGPWTISRSGTNFVAWQANIELYRGEAAPELESVGIRQGMPIRRSWPGGGGVPGLHGGPSPGFVDVRPGETIVIADRPSDWPERFPLASDEYKAQLRQQDALQQTRRLMLLEVPPQIRSVQRHSPPILSPGYVVSPGVTMRR